MKPRHVSRLSSLVRLTSLALAVAVLALGSRADPLCLRYFTANAWFASHMPHGEVLDELCASRYGEHAALMKAAWKAAIPASYLRTGGGNYGKYLAGQGFDAKPAPGNVKKWSGPSGKPSRCASR